MNNTLQWKVAQNAELRWWKNYLKGKDVQPYLQWKKSYWQNILSNIKDSCPVKPGMHVLDVGCGPAGIFMNLQDCITDAADPLIDVYEKNLPHFKKIKYPHVNFYSVPIEHFTSSKTYDIIFCMNAINHVADINASYNLFSALIKPGGKLVITIDAHNYAFYKYLFRIIPGDILHPHQYNLSEYNRFFVERNFTILQITKIKSEYFFNHYLQVAQNK